MILKYFFPMQDIAAAVLSVVVVSGLSEFTGHGHKYQDLKFNFATCVFHN